MKLLIDGYNVLRAVHRGARVSDQQIAAFLKQLRIYKNLKNHYAIVVFDAGPTDGVLKEKIGGISVVYSGVQQTADDYIKKYLKEHVGHDILLISSDNELRDCAKRCQVVAMGAFTFYQRMCEAVDHTQYQANNETESIKLIEDDNPLLDDLMHDVDMKFAHKRDDEMDAYDDRVSSSKKLSKEMRQRMKKIRKL